MIMGQYYEPVAYASLRQQLGLNDPLYVQYWRWFAGLLRGNFGDSLVMHLPAASVVADAAFRSAILAACSFSLTAMTGIGFGVVGAMKRESLLDYLTSLLAFLGISVPEFVTGMALIILFSGMLHWLPSGGYATISSGLLSWLSFLVMPVMTLTLAFMAHVARLTRSGMIEVLQANYVRNARARGLVERAILIRHALPAALLPTITILALGLGAMFGEMVVVETVFAYPGLGRLLVESIQHRDLPLIQACIFVASLAYIMANLVADALYAYVNPRIRFGGASS
jgi:peptide/nickel transport system permease protein